MNDSERLKKIIKYLDTDQSKFGREIGYSQDAINKVVRGRDGGGISKKMASAIVEKYPIFNKAWLLTDIGEMLNNPEHSISENIDVYSRLEKSEAQCSRYEIIIDTLTKTNEVKNQLDIKGMIRELEEKYMKKLGWEVNENMKKLNKRIEELEENLENYLRNSEKD